MELETPIHSFDIWNFTINITASIIIQWIVIAILGICAFLLTRNLKKKPNKKQTVLENIYVVIESLVTNTMGEEFRNFIPYIGSLAIYLLILNFSGLIGIEPPTQDLSITIGLALTTFLTIHYTAIKRNGILGYFKGYIHPFSVMLPISIMERVMLPISLALRLFGNMLAATVLVDLVYEALSEVSVFAQIGLPIIVHGYFDLFDGTIQMIVFTMLTMIQIKLTSEH